jgi:tetratricopeptide (TPR) repeat protein
MKVIMNLNKTATFMVAVFFFLYGCKSKSEQSAPVSSESTIPLNQPVSLTQAKQASVKVFDVGSKLRTDSPGLAIGNLAAAIKHKTALFEASRIGDVALWELVHHHLTFARYFGRTHDFAQAERIVARAIKMNGASSKLHLLRSDVHVALHRFEAAKRDLDTAEAMGTEPGKIADARLGLALSQGRFEAVVPVREKRASKLKRWQDFGRLGIAYAAAGRYEDADKAYQSAIDRYRSTSPMVVAWLYFARGLMWAEEAGQTEKGRLFYERAVSHLPTYLVANIHLAEIEVEAGQFERALSRLKKCVGEDRDPELYAKLAVLYRVMGRADDAGKALAKARTVYAVLLSKYPEAWADHGAEFYMGPGANPKRAFELAKLNLRGRKTPRAAALWIEAAVAAGDMKALCKPSRYPFADEHPHVRWQNALKLLRQRCPLVP